MSENRVFCPMNFAIMKLWALRLRIQTNPLWDIPISLVSIHVSFTVLNYGYSMIYFNIQSDICLGIWKKLSQRANFPRNPGTHRWSSHFLLSNIVLQLPVATAPAAAGCTIHSIFEWWKWWESRRRLRYHIFKTHTYLYLHLRLYHLRKHDTHIYIM